MPNTSRRLSAEQPLDERVSALLAAAAAPTEPGRVPGEEEAVAAFRASHEPSRRYSMLPSLKSARVAAAAALSVGVLVTGGAAAAGTLPGAAQDTAHEMLAELGIDVPGSDGNHAEPANTRDGTDEVEDVEGSEADETSETSEADGTEATAEVAEGVGPGHGEEVSELATSTDLEGREKGEAISELASRQGQERRSEKADVAKERRADTEKRGSGEEDSDESGRGDGSRITPPGDGSDTGDGASDGKSSGKSSDKTEQRGGRP